MSGDGLSRRSFLGASGAGAALSLMPRAVAHAAPVDPAERERHTVDAVVVGAGLSGLVAARELRRAGLSTVVLEARSTIGSSPAGVAGLAETHSRVIDLAAEFRVPVRRSAFDGNWVERAGGSTFRVPAGSYSADSRVDAEVRSALGRLDWMARETDPSEPWRAANATVRDARSLAQWIDGTIRSLPARRRVATLLGAVWGARPSELSLLHALAVGAGSGGVSAVAEVVTAPRMTIEEGDGALAARLARTLSTVLRTGSMVRSIVQDATGAVVTTDSAEIRARRGVIVAVPVAATLGIRFEPDLPGARRLLAQRMPRGSTAMAVCTYTSAFWERRGLSGSAVADEGPMAVAFPVAAGDGRRPALVARFSGSDATEWGSLSPQKRRDASVDALRAVFGDAAGRPSAYDELPSGAAEWPSRGPASLAPPGVLTLWGPALRVPYGLVAWAGSETARAWAGFAEGSVESGERAAAELVDGLTPLAGPSASVVASARSVFMDGGG